MTRSLSSCPNASTKGNGLKPCPMSPSGMRADHLPFAHMFAPVARRPRASAWSMMPIFA